MYKIGDFAKIVDIPVRTLRYYEQCGILKPSEIDNFTGYRYYSDENILECQKIKLLKSLEFTLEEIVQCKEYLDKEMIKKKKKELEERMCLLRLAYDRLSIMEGKLEEGNSIGEVKELLDEKVLRRKYEKRIIGRRI